MHKGFFRALAAVIGLLLAIPSTVAAERIELRTDHEFANSRLQETVISLRDIEKTATTFHEVFDWEIVHRGTVDRAMLAHWDLPDTASAEEIVMRNPGVDYGLVRLVQFSGVEQRRIRPSGKIWDVGGIFDMNLWTDDVDKTASELRERGWHSYSEPMDYAYTTYSGDDVVFREVLMIGPEDIVIALAARIRTPLKNWPAYQGGSHVYTVTTTISDTQASQAFYRDLIGFREVSNNVRRSTRPRNVFGLPANFYAPVLRDVLTYDYVQTNFPLIKIMKFRDVDGEDFIANAQPPNLGLLMVRFVNDDVDQHAARLRAGGSEHAETVSGVELAPYGKVRLVSAQSPEGTWMEFMQAAN